MLLDGITYGNEAFITLTFTNVADMFSAVKKLFNTGTKVMPNCWQVRQDFQATEYFQLNCAVD